MLARRPTLSIIYFLVKSRERLKVKHQNADIMVKEERVMNRAKRRDKKRMTEIGKWMQQIRSRTMNMKNREDKEKIGEDKLEYIFTNIIH